MSAGGGGVGGVLPPIVDVIESDVIAFDVIDDVVILTVNPVQVSCN